MLPSMKALLTIDEFSNLFPDQEHCLDYLYSLRWSNGFRCPHCGCNDYYEVGTYKYKCRNCGYQCTVTAGTLFHDVMLPLTYWFKAAWYLTNVNNKAKRADIKNLLNLGNVHTPQKMLKKLKSAMIRDDFDSIQLKGIVEVSGRSKGIGKRNEKDVDFDSYVFLAVELDDKKKVQRIKMSVYPRGDEESFTDFIYKSVEENSFLQLSFPMRKIGNLNYELPDKVLQRDIRFKYKAFEYNYQYVEKTFDNFMKFYKTSTYSPEEIEEATYEYTKRVNSFYPEITFEELMKNAVNNHTVDILNIPYIK